MIAFAELLERLVFTPGRLAKIALLRRYFATEPDPDRGYGLAAITGELGFEAAKPGLIRALAESRTDPVLFAWSYDYVGDLAETVALMWPAGESGTAAALARRGGGDAGEQPEGRAAGDRRALARCVGCVGALRDPEADHRRAARRRLRPHRQDRARRVRGRAHRRRRHRGGLARPRAALCRSLFAWLEGRGARPDPADAPVFRPLMLAHPLEPPDLAALDAGAVPRRVEMGRHPRAARRDRGRQAHLLARRRRHLGRVSGDRRGDRFRGGARRRAAGDPRRRRRAVRRPAAAAQPQVARRRRC